MLNYKIKNFSLIHFDNLYLFFLVLCVGRGNKIVNALMFPTSPFTTIIFFLLTCILIRRHSLHFGARFWRIIFFTTIWVLFQYVKNSTFDPMSLFLYFDIYIAYIVVNIFGEKVLLYFEKYVTWLAVVNLIVWVGHHIIPQTIESLFEPINMIHGNLVMKSSIIVASISSTSSFLGMRNAGFCSEPGHYASILSLAIAINLFLNKFDVSFKNKSLYVLIVSLITTQSTTGYVSFLFLIIFYVYNTKSISKYIVIVLTIILFPTVWALPFMTEKIEKVWYEDGNEYYIAEKAEEAGDVGAVYVPQRIDGIVLELENVRHDPIIGYGLKRKYSYVGKTFSEYIVLSNGIIQVFASFGLLIGILFYWGLVKSFQMLGNLYHFSGWFILFFLYLSISVSYSFIIVPLLLSIWQMVMLQERNRTCLSKQ